MGDHGGEVGGAVELHRAQAVVVGLQDAIDATARGVLLVAILRAQRARRLSPGRKEGWEGGQLGGLWRQSQGWGGRQAWALLDSSLVGLQGFGAGEGALGAHREGQHMLQVSRVQTCSLVLVLTWEVQLHNMYE